MVADALLPLQQWLVDANQFHGTAMSALERTRLETVELIDRLQLAARTAAIALKMIGANIIIAVPTMRHPETSVGIGALVAAIKTKKANCEIQEPGLKYESPTGQFQTFIFFP